MEINDVIKMAEIQLIATRMERCLCAVLLPSMTAEEKKDREDQAYKVLADLRNWRSVHE